jgi:hypothetical protein
MQSRNDQPNIPDFNFFTDSVFNNIQMIPANTIPILDDYLLITDGTNFNITDGTGMLLAL